MEPDVTQVQTTNLETSIASGTPATPVTPVVISAAAPINYEDLIAKARQQEKEKLYPEITKLKDENVKLIEKNNALLLSLGEKEQFLSEVEKDINRLEAEVKIKAEEGKNNMDKDKTVEALQKQIEDLKAESAKKDEEFKAFITKAELASYMGGRIKEAQLDPDLEELVRGNTKEEIDAAVVKALALQEKMKTKYTPAAPAPQSNVPLPKPTASAINIEQLKAVKPEDIMSMGKEDWAKMRKELGLK